MKSNSNELRRAQIITALYNWVTTFRETPIVKDTTNISSAKFDFYLDSTLTNPLSFTVFEMSDKGELIIDEPQRLIESKAAFFVFVNPKTGWITAVKNNTTNQKKLIRQEPVGNLRVRIIS